MILDSEDLYIQGEVLGIAPQATQRESFFLVAWVNRFFRSLAAREFPAISGIWVNRGH